MDKREREFFVDTFLEDGDFESLLEQFDLTPQDVFEHLFEHGMIDIELLFDLSGCKN
ncbi:MAG: hypothetical protein KDD45_14815 [Bdellovibrionales bacterium]|nr:hypothetical protein [Bdellovibrionales bacterium]